ncbi:hypothetical protein D3C81_88630 [compost metagenome]
MSKQSFTATQREAIWRAHSHRCPYTRNVMDLSNFHIDHILPEALNEKPDLRAETLTKLKLPLDFDLLGWENLLPCHPGANLQKSGTVFDPVHLHFFLGLAADKKQGVIDNLNMIERRENRGRVINLLQQSLERGELSPEEVKQILENHNEAPEAISEHLQGLKFAGTEEALAVSNINLDALLDALRDQLIRISTNSHLETLTLTNDDSEHKVLERMGKEKNKEPLNLFTENINRHRRLFSNILDMEYFQLYCNANEQHSILRGVGPFDISVKNCYIDIDFNKRQYPSRLNEKYQYIDLLYLPVNEIIDLIVHSIECDETIESFSITFDFRPNPLNEMYFSIKTDACNINPDEYGSSSSSIYTVENDELRNDLGMRVPPSRESNYLKIIVASYNIYRRILKHNSD